MEIDDPASTRESLCTSPATSITTNNINNNNDPIVGLDVGGTLFYFHLSILVHHSGSTYFQHRFSGNFNASVAYVDERGRHVYFIDRSPRRFEYVRDYMVTLQLHLPETNNNHDLSLRRALREEAAYFGMPGMMEILQVSHVETPNLSNQGILYWLGTRRRTTAYANPHAMGACYVGGWVDDKEQHYATTRTPGSYFDFAATHKTRENFVGYRTPVRIDTETYLIKHVSFLMSCEHGGARLPVVLDLKKIQVRPTHYSLRASKCKGMEGDWNFEASHDGVTWDILHASRGDNNLLLSDHAPGRRTSAETFLQEAMQAFVYSEEEALDAVISFLELHCRHTWTLDPPPDQFYRFFRIMGASELGTDSCLHGDGLELYGEVYEE